MIRIENLSKAFTLHNQGGAEIDVIERMSFDIAEGEAVALLGASGAGKSTLLRLLYGNYRATSGAIEVRHEGRMLSIVDCEPRLLIDIRRRTLGWVSQFLRAIPRVPTLRLVEEPMLARGLEPLDAAAVGAFVHGSAAMRGPAHGLVAGDVAAALPATLDALCGDVP